MTQTNQDPIFRSLRGSRLYGLHCEDSDYDWFEVYADSRRTRQRQYINDDGIEVDVIRMGLGNFLRLVDETKMPNAIEVLANPNADIAHNWQPFFHNLRTPPVRSALRFIHVARGIMIQHANNLSSKHKLHVARLISQANDLIYHGVFNPRLTPERSLIVRNMSQLNNLDFFASIQQFSVVDLALGEISRTD